MSELSVHEVCNLFPMMTDEEYGALVADIHANGQREPILTLDGKVIDGRNRYKACQQLGIAPKVQEWSRQGSVIDFVVSLNLHRRHLTASQKAVVGLRLLPWLEQEAVERVGGRPPKDEKPRQIVDQVSGKASEQAAKMVGANRQYVSDAKAIQQKAPELLESVRQGEITIPEAKRQIKSQERQAMIEEYKAAPPVQSLTGPFGVIYADPPWRYDFSKDNADSIEAHYPTMEVGEICALPIQDIAETDCVLFLWATSPKLTEALAVMAAWGFAYKTNMVWDKELIGLGYYARQQHEILLIGSKGSPGVPDPESRPPSVVRARRGRHSEKPVEFYDIIERMYPISSKVELFCRNPHEGWSVWGNEV